MTAAPDPDDAADGDEPRYAYKPSLVGAPCEFALMPEALHWRIGRRSGDVRYDRVRSVRMSFRPVTMQSHRFITEIRSPDSPKIQISSVSWRSLMEQERLDAAYSAFIADLHRRLAAAGPALFWPACRLFYWSGVVLVVVFFSAACVVWAESGQGKDETPGGWPRFFCFCFFPGENFPPPHPPTPPRRPPGAVPYRRTTSTEQLA